MIDLKHFPLYEESFLRQKSTKVEPMDLFDLEAELYDKFPSTGAHAVAAPQIGILKRACLIKLPSTKEFLLVLNPEILEMEEPFLFQGEGCLSFPKDHRDTERFNRVKVKYQDREFEERTVIAENLEAVIFQHEIDHMDGILYKDHLQKPMRLAEPKIGRNDPCPCGSGKKFKKCHGG